jgi:hypothetical protein
MEINRIERIEVRNLLGKYDLNWYLNPDVNILVGINGSGKTTVLRIVNSLLSGDYKVLKSLEANIKIVLGGGKEIAYENRKPKSFYKVNHTLISTFDVTLRSKLGLTETPLDKELKELIYTVGQNKVSFSNYRLKATNYPERAEYINKRIKDLFSLIDRMFSQTNKTIAIDPATNSLIFNRGNNNVIPLSRLSSGEKQLLLILFGVFLMEDNPYILLMDEPEISLHIGWQQELIDIIRQLNPNCQLIMTTHSPSIFGEGWGDKLFFIEDLSLE